jgi:hypothetical protein
MLKFLADRDPIIIPGAKSWCFGASRHAVERFIERIRPEMDAARVRLEFQRLHPISFRENSKRDGTWYLMYDYQPPFSLVAALKLLPDHKAPYACRQAFRALTTLKGHDHW